ncbi:MAG: hypothetical protein IPM47_06080 [Sphingobacteriales bacterium]|nr:MAG: hypothetical protein IPM47_06080 [Sphingobacteriales bacterium]
MKKQHLVYILMLALTGLGFFNITDCFAQRTPVPSKNSAPSDSENDDGNKTTVGKFDRSRFFVEGNIGFNFGNGFGFISASPTLGYWFTNRFSAGAGPIFEYYRWSSYKGRVLGGRTFARYQVFNNLFNSGGNLFVHGQYDFLTYKDNYLYENKRAIAHRLPIGAGFSQPMGRVARFNLMVLYDVLYNKNKNRDIPIYNNGYIYNGFIIQGGINFGF